VENNNCFYIQKQSKMAKKRRNFSPKFKAKVALDAIRERHSLVEHEYVYLHLYQNGEELFAKNCPTFGDRVSLIN